MNRLHLRFVLATALLCVANVASAQDGFDVQRLAPSLDGARGFWSLPAGATADRLQWGGSARLHFGSNPFVAERGSSDIAVVSGQLQLDVSGFVGVTNWFELSAGLPVVVSQSGEAATSVVGLREPATGAGVGDARVAMRVQVLGPDQRVNANGLDLSLGFEARIPLGDPVRFQGDDGPRYQPNLTAEYSLRSGIRAGVQLGYSSRPDVQIDSLEIKDELTWALAAALPVGNVSFIPELAGGVPLGERQSSMEARGGARYQASDLFAVDLAAGFGVVAGVGNAGWRVIGGLHFSQRSGNDRDGDGIPNAIDECPTRAEDYDRDRDADGCPDLDDDLPAEPTDPVEPAEPPEPVESVEPPEPVEPVEPLEPVEPVEPVEPTDTPRRGFGTLRRVRDMDEDGVPDDDDLCPETPEALDDPFHNGDGCPTPDTDQDGFLDPADLCVDEPETYNGVADHDGCPDGFEHVEAVCDFIFLLTPITFDGRSDDFSGETTAVLDEVAAALENSAATSVRVEAHTDSEGDAGENSALTQSQAEAVVDYLEGVGVSVELSASGMGEEMPIAGNDSAEGRAENRRIEFHLSGGCD